MNEEDYYDLHETKESLKMDDRTEEDYVPYGEEWEKEMMKLPKKFLINMYRESKKEHQDECADVGNFAMMIMDNLSNLKDDGEEKDAS